MSRARTLRFLDGFVGQIAQSAVCSRHHTGQQRLARWLLTVSERAAADTIPLTHEFAAMMLGAVRPRVTAALRTLQVRGVVRYGRREITILDRGRLARESCGCYRPLTSSGIDPDR